MMETNAYDNKLNVIRKKTNLSKIDQTNNSKNSKKETIMFVKNIVYTMQKSIYKMRELDDVEIKILNISFEQFKFKYPFLTVSGTDKEISELSISGAYSDMGKNYPNQILLDKLYIFRFCIINNLNIAHIVIKCYN